MADENRLPRTISSLEPGELRRRSRRVAELVTRLMLHYWRENDDPAARQAQIEDWIEDLIEFPVECVEDACRQWRRTPGGRRPTPGDIRSLAIAAVREIRLALSGGPKRCLPTETAEWGIHVRAHRASRPCPLCEGGESPSVAYVNPEYAQRVLERILSETGAVMREPFRDADAEDGDAGRPTQS